MPRYYGRKPARKGNPETAIQTDILNYLKNELGVFAVRLNNHAVPVLGYGPGGPTFRGFRKSKWATPGVPDIMVLLLGKVFFIEVKAPGGTLSEGQVAFANTCAELAIEYFVHYDVAETRALFIQRGWARR